MQTTICTPNAYSTTDQVYNNGDSDNQSLKFTVHST